MFVEIPSMFLDTTSARPAGHGYLFSPKFSKWLSNRLPVKLQEIDHKICIDLRDAVEHMSFNALVESH